MVPMRFPIFVALLSLASCALAQDTDIPTVVAAFNSANIPTAFGLRFSPTSLLQVTFPRNPPYTFSSGTNVPRDATAPVPTFKLVGATDTGPYVIATVDPDGGSFGHVRHFLAGNYQLDVNTGALTNTSAPITAWFQPTPGAGNPAHRYVFWAFKQSPDFNQQRIVTAQTYIGNFNLSSLASQTQLGDPVAASFMLVKQ